MGNLVYTCGHMLAIPHISQFPWRSDKRQGVDTLRMHAGFKHHGKHRRGAKEEETQTSIVMDNVRSLDS